MWGCVPTVREQYQILEPPFDFIVQISKGAEAKGVGIGLGVGV